FSGQENRGIHTCHRSQTPDRPGRAGRVQRGIELIEGLALLGQGGQEFGIGDKCVSPDFLALKTAERRFISRTKEGCSGADVSSKLGCFFASLDGDLNWTVWTW